MDYYFIRKMHALDICLKLTTQIKLQSQSHSSEWELKEKENQEIRNCYCNSRFA